MWEKLRMEGEKVFSPGKCCDAVVQVVGVEVRGAWNGQGRGASAHPYHHAEKGGQTVGTHRWQGATYMEAGMGQGLRMGMGFTCRISMGKGCIECEILKVEARGIAPPAAEYAGGSAWRMEGISGRLARR